MTSRTRSGSPRRAVLNSASDPLLGANSWAHGCRETERSPSTRSGQESSQGRRAVSFRTEFRGHREPGKAATENQDSLWCCVFHDPFLRASFCSGGGLNSYEGSIFALMLTGPALVLNHRVSQSITGTVKANPRVESKSIAAVSARAEWYRSANSAPVSPTGKLQHTSAACENGLSTESK